VSLRRYERVVEDLQQAEQEYTTLKNEHDQLKIDFNVTASALDDYVERVKTEQAKKSSAYTRYNKAVEIAENARRLTVEKDNVIDQLQKKLSNERIKTKAQESDLITARKAVDNLQQELRAMQDRHKEERENNLSTIAELRAIQDGRKEKKEENVSTIAELQNEVEQLKKEREFNKSRISELQMQLQNEAKRTQNFGPISPIPEVRTPPYRAAARGGRAGSVRDTPSATPSAIEKLFATTPELRRSTPVSNSATPPATPPATPTATPSAGTPATESVITADEESTDTVSAVEEKRDDERNTSYDSLSDSMLMPNPNNKSNKLGSIEQEQYNWTEHTLGPGGYNIPQLKEKKLTEDNWKAWKQKLKGIDTNTFGWFPTTSNPVSEGSEQPQIKVDITKPCNIMLQLTATEAPSKSFEFGVRAVGPPRATPSKKEEGHFLRYDSKLNRFVLMGKLNGKTESNIKHLQTSADNTDKSMTIVMKVRHGQIRFYSHNLDLFDKAYAPQPYDGKNLSIMIEHDDNVKHAWNVIELNYGPFYYNMYMHDVTPKSAAADAMDRFKVHEQATQNISEVLQSISALVTVCGVMQKEQKVSQKRGIASRAASEAITKVSELLDKAPLRNAEKNNI